MMLSQSDIRKRMVVESVMDRLFIVPFFDEQQLNDDSASLDLRLGTRFAIARRRRLTHIELYGGQVDRPLLVEEHYVPLGERFVIHPGHFVLATTLEWLRLPPNVGAYVTGKSSLVRFGLNVSTGIGVQPGFAGTLPLELANSADIPMEIRVGQAICQVFFHMLNSTAARQGTPENKRRLSSKYPVLMRPEPGNVDRFLKLK